MGFKVPEQLIPCGTKGLAHSSCTTHQQHNKALIATLPSITKASNIPKHTQDGSGLEGPESFPNGAVLARLKEVKGAPIFATKQSQNQLKEDRFWPPKHGLQQHKGRKEKDTSFLEETYPKKMF